MAPFGSSFYSWGKALRSVGVVGAALVAVVAMQQPLGAQPLSRGRLSVETEALGSVLDGQVYVLGLGSTLRWTIKPDETWSPIVGAQLGVIGWGGYVGGELGVDRCIIRNDKRVLSAMVTARGGLLSMGFSMPMVTLGGRVRGERFFGNHFGMSTTLGVEYEFLMQGVLVPLGVGCVWRF